MRAAGLHVDAHIWMNGFKSLGDFGDQGSNRARPGDDQSFCGVAGWM
jgi:hypothetical protein